MALSQGAGRGTKPLATVVIGGLLTAITHPLSITNPLYLVRKFNKNEKTHNSSPCCFVT
jgi:Cu/Ag efflux pump CusA